MQALRTPTLDDIVGMGLEAAIPEARSIPVASPAEMAQLKRMHDAQSLRTEYKLAVERYNSLAGDLHEHLRTVWEIASSYHNMTSHPLPDLELQKFRSINVPPLGKASGLDIGYSTTEQAISNYQHYRTW